MNDAFHHGLGVPCDMCLVRLELNHPCSVLTTFNLWDSCIRDMKSAAQFSVPLTYLRKNT
jgi:hypothetical protein